MRLYLHCGYHKTGSSFLQTMFSRNRELLQQGGYYFPFSEREYDMKMGVITPGNGPALAEAIKSNNLKKCKGLLAGYISDAKKKRCKYILLSSENFFHAFENNHALECLIKTAEECGIKKICALLYFRDPVSHALSTYKHRAKNGNISNFTEWLKEDYETIRLIDQFNKYYKKYNITWSCRKYTADSEHMVVSAFSDWLKVLTPQIPKNDRVNASLTLSEIIVIQTIKEENPKYVDFLRRAFQDLAGSQKAEDNYLSKIYKYNAAQILLKSKPVIEKVNKLLPENEKLVLMEPNRHVDYTNKENAILSKQQLHSFTEAIIDASKSDYLHKKVKSFSNKVFDKIIRKVKTISA